MRIHSKKRNRLDHKRLHDLVYIKYNQQLAQRYDIWDEMDLVLMMIFLLKLTFLLNISKNI